MTQDMEPAALERLAIETLARARARTDGMLATVANRAFDLQVIPGHARAGEGGVLFVMRMMTWEDGAIQDIKEQEVWVVPGDADERTPAYFEGIVRGFQRLAAERPDAIATYMPHDFIPSRSFRDPACRTADDFAAHVGAAEPDLADVIDDPAGTEPIARNPALERAIDDDPSRDEAYLVYADWLTEQGDPRGELIACMMPDASPEAKRRGAAVFAQHERYFVGGLASSERLGNHVQIGFQRGFLDEVRIAVDYQLAEEVPDFAARVLRTLMRLYSSRFLRGLTLGCIDLTGECNFEKLYPILVDAGPRPSLAHLFIGDTTPEEQEISWTHAGNLAPLAALYPNLESLRVHAGSMELADALGYPRLARLSLETGGLSAENVREVARRTFPRLTSLELWLGSESYGGTASLDDLAPILAGDRLPALQRLALRNYERTDDLVGPLAASRILPRVRELDLSMGILTDAGAQALLANKRAFAHLAKLDVSDNFLSAAAVASLAGLGIEVVSGVQKHAYDDDPANRYVSVGE